MGLLVGPAGRTSWTNQLDGPAGRTSWMDQLERPAGQTSSFYLKPWPVCIFKDFPFSLYVVAASESDEGLVYFGCIFLGCLSKLSILVHQKLGRISGEVYQCHQMQSSYWRLATLNFFDTAYTHSHGQSHLIGATLLHKDTFGQLNFYRWIKWSIAWALKW